jgi:hypothetical protein
VLVWIVEPCATPYKLQLFIIVSKYIFNVSHRYGKYKKKILSAWELQQSPGYEMAGTKWLWYEMTIIRLNNFSMDANIQTIPGLCCNSQAESIFFLYLPYRWLTLNIYLLTIIKSCNFEKLLRRIIVISYHNHFVPAISYNSENHFRTICRSIHYYHFVPYADRHIMTISYHMQINTLWPFHTICKILCR